MFFAVLTAVLFAGSAICNTRITNLLDTIAANFWRLVIATAALGLLTVLTDPKSFHASSFGWLLLSGFIGFGIGDIALFSAFLRIGSRLTVLINFCLGTIIAALGDWLWLGDGISGREWLAISVIMAGLAIALLSGKPTGTRQGSFGVGVLAALIGAVGQGLGATLSRLGTNAAELEGITIGGISQAFQRVLAGLACLALVYLWRRSRGKLMKASSSRKQFAPWILCAAMLGPVLGVSCFQQSLSVIGNSGIVMAVVATSPLLLIPLAFIFEGDRPTRGSIIGAVIGVGGVVALALLRP